MKIHRLKLTKQKLAAMPESYRTLLLLLGHAVNEINILSKLILMVRKDDPQSDIINHVEAGQAIVFLRLLIGKLHEAWLLFRKRVQADRTVREELIPHLETEGEAALKALNRHFGRGSPLTDIRNKASFHYTDDDNLTEENFQKLSDTEPWEFYLASSGNTFYYASELVMTASATQLAYSGDTPANVDQAFKNLCDIAIEATRNLTCLFDELIAALVETIPDLEHATTEELPDGPELSKFCLPYFFRR
jgi:hypothetical protein